MHTARLVLQTYAVNGALRVRGVRVRMGRCAAVDADPKPAITRRQDDRTSVPRILRAEYGAGYPVHYRCRHLVVGNFPDRVDGFLWRHLGAVIDRRRACPLIIARSYRAVRGT